MVTDWGGRHRHRLPWHMESKVMIRRGTDRRRHMPDGPVDRSLTQGRGIMVRVVAISVAILAAHGVRHGG